MLFVNGVIIKMKKSESILELERLGLNILPYFCSRDKQELLHYLAKHAGDIVSMRTERGDDYNCPYYYSVRGEELIQKAIQHLNEGYVLILYPSLDIRGCRAFGTVALTDNDDIIEFVIGQGKIRDLYTHPDKKTVIIPPATMIPVKASDYGENAEMLNLIYKTIKEKCEELNNIVIEWSWYKSLVGLNQEHLICWELRKYK